MVKIVDLTQEGIIEQDRVRILADLTRKIVGKDYTVSHGTHSIWIDDGSGYVISVNPTLRQIDARKDFTDLAVELGKFYEHRQKVEDYQVRIRNEL